MESVAELEGISLDNYGAGDLPRLTGQAKKVEDKFLKIFQKLLDEKAEEKRMSEQALV